MRSTLSSLITRASLLCLFEFHKEALELRRVSIWIHAGWGKIICRGLVGLAFVFGNASVTPVDRDPDLICLLSINHHGLDSSRDHRFSYVLAASAGHFDQFAALEPPF